MSVLWCVPETSFPAESTRRPGSRLIAGGTACNRRYPGRQQPYDAFWGARYAIVEDPDGNPVRLISPVDAGLRHWPPAPPPPGT